MTRLPAVLRAQAPAWTPAAPCAGPCEATCLSKFCSPRWVDLLLEAVAAVLPPVAVALDPRQLLAQPFDLSFLFPNAGIVGILPWSEAVAVAPRTYGVSLSRIAHVLIFGFRRIRKLPRQILLDFFPACQPRIPSP